MKKIVVFLDFDGVVNNVLWSDNYKFSKGKLAPAFAHPFDGFVNNFQAVCWLNKLYEDFHFDIVVTSSWREFDCSVADCLYNGGLNRKIKVFQIKDGSDRPKLINDWIKENNFSGEYIIFDDEDYYTINGFREYTPLNTKEMTKRFVKTSEYAGITFKEYSIAKEILEKITKKSKKST